MDDSIIDREAQKMDSNDINDLIEILATDICIHQNEEKFLRRSAESSTNEQAKAMLLDMANEMRAHLEKLNTNQSKLKEMLLEMHRSRID